MKVTGVERFKGKADEGYSLVEFAIRPDTVKVCVLRFLPLVYDYLREVKGSIIACISPLTALMMEQKTKYSHQGLFL